MRSPLRLGQADKGHYFRGMMSKLFPHQSSSGNCRTMEWKSAYHVHEGHYRIAITPTWVYYYVAVSFGVVLFLLFFHFKSDSHPTHKFQGNPELSASLTTSADVWDIHRRIHGYCPPQKQIFFLKTHKCASSTVQNILMRYGDQRNLTFVLPVTANYIGHPDRFSKSIISSQKIPERGFDILCHHLRLDVDEVRSVLSPSAAFVTIVRDPATLFRSMYDYYEISNVTSQTMEDFILDGSTMDELATERFQERLGNNQMMFDLGYDPSIWKNESLVNRAIREVDETFDLVMVAEFFDESLILLKHLLCWNMEDIVYLVHNRRTVDHLTSKNSLKLSQKIREYNAADQMLYDHFVEKLNKTIDHFGRERMSKEVQDLRIWNKVWFDHCVQKLSSGSENVPSSTRAYSSKVYSFVLNREPTADICKLLAMAELPYTKKLAEKQNSL